MSVNLEHRRALTHEAGHVLMARIQGISYTGVFIEAQKTGRYCMQTLRTAPYDSRDYLQLAAGAAAEKVMFGSVDIPGSRHDRDKFSEVDWGPVFDEAVKILRAHRKDIQLLTRALIDQREKEGWREAPEVQAGEEFLSPLMSCEQIESLFSSSD